MRTNLKAWIVACCFLAFGTAAHAGILTSASWQGEQFGELGPFGFLDLFPGTTFTLVSSGASLTASGSAAGSAIQGVSLTVAMPPLSLVGAHSTGLSQTLGGSQTINSAHVANQEISGAFRTYIGSPATGILLFPVALSAGVAGNFTTTSVVPGLNIPVEVTATFFPWTTGFHVVSGLTGTTTSINGATNKGVALPDVTFAGTNSLAGGVGSITLVSPTRFSI